ncbi:MAG: MBL fold metallo-hydrolase [Thermoleophilia bacterium]|nr:MBL fold metallo-hydrolase [Thermoleophilia bacterium]
MAGNIYRWDIVVPAHRYVFAVQDGRIVEFVERGEESFHRFSRYQAIKPDHPVHGMIAWPNTVLLRGPLTVVVDPGLVIQGPPLLLGLERLGVDPEDVDLVVNTHHHVDHTHANVYFPGATGVIHKWEYNRYLSEYRLGFEPPNLRLLEGEEGEIGPGLRFLLTPGHTAASICVVARVAEGTLVVAGDTVGPLPEYFDRMKLPDGFPERKALIDSWWKIRELRPDVLIPGHNPLMMPARD